MWIGKTSKFSIDAPGLKPRLALIVPDLTLTLPKPLILSTALDAGGSCSGSVLVQAHYPLGKRFLHSKTLRVITANLKAALKAPKDYELFSEKLCRGSLLAGLAFSQTPDHGLPFHFLSAVLVYFQVPHGFAVALTMAEVARINEKAAKNYDELAAVFAPFGGIDGWLSSVCEDLIELRLGTFGIQKKDISRLSFNMPLQQAEWII